MVSDADNPNPTPQPGSRHEGEAATSAPLDFGPSPEDRAIARPQAADVVEPEGDDTPEPTLTGGEIPPLFADVDDDAEPKPHAPPAERPLTERISQGLPSYAEPEPHIAGVVGRG